FLTKVGIPTETVGTRVSVKRFDRVLIRKSSKHSFPRSAW
ncbi:MAG: hypothetical protein ACI909_003004, partial [Planctomycetota bacterium]